MQISGLPPDIYSTFEFALYAFLISLGFVYLLKYTDSHNYVQENGNFGGGGGDQVDGDGGGGGGGYEDDDDQVRGRDREDRDRDQVPSAPFSREFCGVCGDWAYSRCSRCKAVRYCSESCQIKHWRAGHKIECREFNKSHSKVDSDFAAGRGRQSSGYMGTSSSDYQHSKDGSSDETIQSSKIISRKEHRIVEECPICLSTIHTSRHSRPSIGCDTCKHKFHSTCLSKWFLSSKKSSCPLCLSTFRSGGKIVQSSIKIDRS